MTEMAYFLAVMVIAWVLGANSCPPGEVPAAMSGKCVALCQVMGCDECNGDSCAKCLPGLTLLESGNCATGSGCPFNSYQLRSECYACHPLCASCFGPTKNQCLSCKATSNSTLIYAEGSTCNSAPIEAGDEVCGLGRGLGHQNACSACPRGCAKCHLNQNMLKCLVCEREASLKNDECEELSTSLFKESKDKTAASSDILVIAISLFIVGALGMAIVSRVLKCLRFFGLFKRSHKPPEHEPWSYSQPYPPFARAHISRRYKDLP